MAIRPEEGFAAMVYEENRTGREKRLPARGPGEVAALGPHR